MNRYTGATPPMPDHFKARMQDTLGGLETMHTIHRRNKLTVSLAAALIAMLALAGIAYAAAQSGILTKIFTRSEPAETAEQSVVHVNSCAESELMSLTINDYVFSGSDLYVDWVLNLKTDERLVLLSSGLTAALPDEAFTDNFVRGGLASNLQPWTDLMPSASSGMNQGYFYSGAPDGPVEISMRLSLIRPDPDALQVEYFTVADYDSVPVWIYDDDSVYWQYGYHYDGENSESDETETYAYDAGVLSQGEFFKKYGFGELIDELEVSFTVYPSGTQLRTLAAHERYEFDGYTLKLQKAEFNGFNAEIVCLIQSDDPDFMDSGIWFFAFADGKPLNFSTSLEGSGNEYLFSFWSDGGCTLLPDEITLAPGEYVRGRDSQEPKIDMDRAVSFKLQ